MFDFRGILNFMILDPTIFENQIPDPTETHGSATLRLVSKSRV